MVSMARVPQLVLSPMPRPPISTSFLSSSLNFLIRNPRLHLHHHHHHNQSLIPKTPSPLSCYRNGSTPPSETKCPVPVDQQPVNEYESLSASFPFSWASGDLVQYSSRLLTTGVSFTLFVGLPVAWFGAVGPESEPVKRVLGAVSSGIFVVTLAVVRMYLGWAYVGNRLLSATVEYEETGWYDGQIWVKTAEVLARDRLLGSFSVSSYSYWADSVYFPYFFFLVVQCIQLSDAANPCQKLWMKTTLTVTGNRTQKIVIILEIEILNFCLVYFVVPVVANGSTFQTIKLVLDLQVGCFLCIEA
ncbi:uncharacterized protein LOC131150851 isoform X1 [Malania oleifera]|uniref:uncharacterized protein LOC131150851 isoform X1 n=1 Tax=Malania oleifera TaxID=397392 RepID=UPI0025ADEE6D|nr:uncharacterized protein LOC131150851 isoform X1 [Malania oleifera]